MDANYWGLICVPLGLVLGFGPVLVAWFLCTRPAAGQDDPKSKH